MSLRHVTPSGYRRTTVVALVMLCVIVLTGALVRLTGSGLGCSDWPACNEERFIDVSTGHGAIEQVNRLFTGVVAASVALAVLGSLWRVPRRRDLTRLSLGLVAGVVGQVVLGGIVVLTDLHPAANQGHFLLSMVLVANALVLVRRAGEPDGVGRRPAVTPTAARLTWLVAALTSAAVLTGTVVTGTGPHAGDEEARRFGFDISTVARIHGITVVTTILVTLALSAWLTRRSPADWRVLGRPLEAFVILAVVQGVVGYVQYFGGVPVGLVAVHIVLATLVFLAAVWLVLSTRMPEEVRVPQANEPIRAATARNSVTAS
jgi:cytochrome c oxidase assembly protein subunit 15